MHARKVDADAGDRGVNGRVSGVGLRKALQNGVDDGIVLVGKRDSGRTCEALPWWLVRCCVVH